MYLEIVYLTTLLIFMRFNKHLLIFIVTCLALHFQSSTAHDLNFNVKDIQALNDDKRALIIGSEKEFPPFATGFTNETAGGFTVELWKAVAAELGLKYSLRVLPFHQVLKKFKAGKIDILINFAQSEQRREFADFTVPHVVVNGGIFVRKGYKNIRTENDLASQSIIVLNGDLAHDYAISKGWNNQLVLVNTVETGLRLLASGKHDAMLLSKLTGLQTLQKKQISNIDVLNTNVGFSQKFSFAVQKGQSELLSKLNEGLAITKSNNLYQKIYEKWFGVYEVKEPGLYEILKYSITPIVLLLGLLAHFYISRKNERQLAVEEMKIAATAFETQEGIFVTDQNFVILRVNKAFTTITGFAAKDAIGQTLNSLHANTSIGATYINVMDETHKSGFWEGEIVCCRQNGETYPKMLTITAVKNTHDNIRNFVGIFTNNTENKKLEEQRLLDEVKYRETLVREVHHRIKNNLQGVLLLLHNMTDSFPELTKAMETVMAKVRSIAIVHGIQGNNSNSSMIVTELINAISQSNQSLFNVYNIIDMQADMPTIYLLEKEAVPTALIINELILNAIKHSKNSTSIFISLYYDIANTEMVIQIKNKGELTQDLSLNQPILGTGLMLVKSLIPKNNFALSWKQEKEWVVATVVLNPPVISITPDASIH